MHFFIVFVATTIALFWDEALITILGVLTQNKFSAKFILWWVLVSGILASILIAIRVPDEYRVITMTMIGVAVLFNINSQKNKSL